MKRLKQSMAVTAGMVVLTVLTVWAGAADSLLVTKDQLIKMMEDENLVILDVRRAGGWESSRYKIKGAVREEPERFSRWYKNYAKDKTIVLYCS